MNLGFQFSRYSISLILLNLLVACVPSDTEIVATTIPLTSATSQTATLPIPGGTLDIETAQTSPLPEIASPTFPLETQDSGTVELPLPSGKPAVVWNGVPIMPGAISGEETEDGYSYTVQAAPEEVKDYYEFEMDKLGWTAFAIGKGETGSLLLMYQKEGKTTTVSVFTQGDLSLILLVQY